MNAVKKIKVLICDDRQISADTVLASVFQAPTSTELTIESLLGAKDASRADYVRLAETSLDVRRCSTVSEALEALQSDAFDLAWVDINFEDAGQPEQLAEVQAIDAQYRGLYLLREIKTDYPGMIVKVHSRLAADMYVSAELQKAGLGPTDIAFILDHADIVIPIGNILRASFILALKEVAQHKYYEATDSANKKELVDNEIDKYRLIDPARPLQSLQGFSIETLLVGWAVPELTPDRTLRLALPPADDLSAAIADLRALRNGAIQLSGNFTPGKRGFKHLMEFREAPGYSQTIYPALCRDAERIIQALLPAIRTLSPWSSLQTQWRTLRAAPFQTQVASVLPDIEPIPKHAHGILERSAEFLNKTAEWRAVLQNLLTARLVLIGMLEMRDRQQTGDFPYVVDFTILYGLMREYNRFVMLLDDFRKVYVLHTSVKAHFRTTLGIAGSLTGAIQECWWNRLLPEEQDWLCSDFFKKYPQNNPV